MNNDLYEQLLPVQMFIKSLIKGKNENYENYILEVINNSLYFYKKSKGLKYIKSKQESHGECDCYAGDYGLDFKLFGSESMFNTISNFSSRIIVQDECALFTSSRKQGEGKCSNLHKLFRFYDFNEQKLNLPTNNFYNKYIKDLKYFTKVLVKPKNLLFFYPVTFLFKIDNAFNIALDSIIKAISQDFLSAFKFRKKYCEDKETYLMFLYNDFFVILKYKNDKFVIVDYVNVRLSETFNRMYWEYVL